MRDPLRLWISSFGCIPRTVATMPFDLCRTIRGPATSVDTQTLTLAEWPERGLAATRPAVTGEGLKPLTTR